MSLGDEGQGFGMTLATATDLADRACFFLRPLCERIEVVGSVRRGKAMGIHDIEALCVPRRELERPCQFFEA